MTHGWAGRLFLDAGALLFLGPGGVAARHAHHAVQLVWAEVGALTLTFAAAPVDRRAALVPADAPHAFDATGRSIALLLVEPHSARGAALGRLARERPGAELADRLDVPFPPRDLTPLAAAAWIDRVVTCLGGPATRPPLSAPTRAVIAFVEAHQGGVLRLPDAAREVGLSPTRLTHRFSREVGIPFRRFVLWTRLARAVEASRSGADLTRAAVTAGFSDSAHLSRTCRAMFGLSPSTVLDHVELVGGPRRGS